MTTHELLTDKEKIKILLVDDKASNLEVLENILQSDEYELHKAESGKEALKLILNNEYACCLLDIRMPGIDGFQVAEIIRNDPELQHIPILFVTAEVKDRESMFKGYEKGAVDFIQKPLEPQIIRSKVAVFVELMSQRKKLDKTLELEQLNLKLENLNSTLISTNRDLEHFNHMAAHDMHEPARRLLNLVDLLQVELDNPSENIKHLLGAIKSSTNYILAMVNDFRSLTSIDYNEQEKININLKQIIKECLIWHEKELKHRNIQIEFDDFPETVHVYYSLMKHFYDNIIKNALEHVHENNFKIHFLAKKNEDGRWIFGVINTKSTIEKEKLNEIFMMYRNYDPNSKSSTGLGLAICKKIIDKHQGKIWATHHTNSFQISFTVGEQ